jgi:predicted flap endonuclease-1-like 5' DNA nuclease
VDELDPAWLESQAQVIKDVYAQGEDPHFRHPTPAEAQDEIDERVAALLAAHADEEDPLATVISPSPVTAPSAGVPSAGVPSVGATSAGPPGDDLTRIEGIGPKIAAALNGAGIRTYTQLASAPAAKLEALMAEGGYNLAEPATWPEQAELAAGGRWQELEALQA